MPVARRESQAQACMLLFNQPEKIQAACWHRPVIVRDMQTRLGDVIGY